MSEQDITALLQRQAEALPPPPATDLDVVLRTGDHRRRRRLGSYAAAASLLLVVAVGIGTSLRPGPGPVTPPEITQPFGPILAGVSVCGAESRCQPVSPQVIEDVTDVIEASGIATVVDVRDAKEVASRFPSDDETPHPDEVVQTMSSEVIFRIEETTDPTPLFRDLIALPWVDLVRLGTATVAPLTGFDFGEPGEEPAPKVDPVEYHTLEVPVAGRDETVAYTTYRNDQGQLCIEDPNGHGCSWTSYGPGLLSSSAGPWTEAEVERHCVDLLAGYDVARVEVTLGDGTPVPTVSIPARPDLASPRLVAGCWVGPKETVTTVAYSADGTEIDRNEVDPTGWTPPPGP